MVIPNRSDLPPAIGGVHTTSEQNIADPAHALDPQGAGQQPAAQRPADGSGIYRPPSTGVAHEPADRNRMFAASPPDRGAGNAAATAVAIPMAAQRPRVPPLAVQGEIPPVLQDAWTRHVQTSSAHEELCDWYAGPAGPSRIAIGAAFRDAVITAVGTGLTFGAGVGAATALTNGFTNDLAGRLAPNGGNQTIGLGDWHQGLVPNGVSSSTGHPAPENLALGIIRDSSRIPIGATFGAMGNIAAANGVAGGVAGIFDPIAGGRLGVTPVDPRTVYPDVNPLGPDNMPRDLATMSELMAPVLRSRLEMRRIQDEYATLKSSFAIRLGSAVFASMNAAVNDATQWPVPNRLGPAASWAVSTLVSGVAGAVTGLGYAAWKMSRTVDAPVLDAHGDPLMDAEGKPVTHKLPIFRATKTVVPSDANRNFFTDSYFARNIEAQFRVFRGGRTGMAALSHYFDQFNKRFAGIAVATLPQVLVNLTAAAARNKAEGNVAARLIVNTAAPALNLVYAVNSWFKESARLNSELAQTSTDRARAPLLTRQSAMTARDAASLVDHIRDQIVPRLSPPPGQASQPLTDDELRQMTEVYGDMHLMHEISEQTLHALEDMHAPDGDIVQARVNHMAMQRALSSLNQLMVGTGLDRQLPMAPVFGNDHEAIPMLF